jgi:hypothetical protein
MNPATRAALWHLLRSIFGIAVVLALCALAGALTP